MNLTVQSPTQIAWVTPDLDATETALTGLLGVRKWVRIPDVHFAPETCSYHGKPADFVASISLSYLGDMQLELISPVRGENVYSDFLRDSGPGLHHICMEAESPQQFDAALADATDQGAPVVQQGVMPGGHPIRLRVSTAGGRAVHRDRVHLAKDAGLLRLHQTGATVNTEIPATVSADTVTSWSDDVDVVVIGFGIGGGCAAVSAAAAGARVLVLERAAAAGGTTSLAGGHFYLGGGTAVQQATGHPDSPEEMYKYLVAVSRQPDHAKIRAYCDGSVEHFNWLEDLGFQFERSYFPGKVVVPAGTEGLSYTGNEKVWPFCEQAEPAPRGHSVPVPGELGGAAMVIDLLVKRADAWECRSATRPGQPISSWTTTARWSASPGSVSPKPARSRPTRSSSPPAVS